MKKTKKNIDMTTEGINDMWEEVEHPHRKDESSNQKNKTRKTYQDVNRRKSRPRYAPGIQYDNYGDRSFQSRKIVSKPKRNWGTRIALFLLLMIAMYFVKKTGIGDLSQSNNTLNPNAPTTPDSSVAGVRFNYHLDYIDFTA
nr:hypothetical protein [Lachnospiraceae bacterium]